MGDPSNTIWACWSDRVAAAGEADMARNDRRSWAVTLPAEVQVEAGLWRLEPMSWVVMRASVTKMSSVLFWQMGLK